MTDTPPKQVTKKQHWVPQFYLKKFTDVEGKLRAFNVKSYKLMSRRYAPAEVCYGDFFYAVQTGKEDTHSQEVEAFFTATEDNFAQIYPQIEEQILSGKHLEDQLRYDFCLNAALLQMRSPYFRENLNQMQEQMTKQVAKVTAGHDGAWETAKERMKLKDPNISEETLEQIRESLMKGEYSLQFSNMLHFQMMAETKGFANLLFHKKWRIHITDSEPFFTSDNPVIEVFPERKGIYGPTFLERKHYFALSPKILIEFIDPDLPGKAVKRQRVENEFVRVMNKVRCGHSYQYVYSAREEDFTNIVEFTKKVAYVEKWKWILGRKNDSL